MAQVKTPQADQYVWIDPWDGHPFYPLPDGVQEETYDYLYEVTVAAGLLQVDVPLRVDADADFQLRALLGEYFGVGGGIAEVSLTSPSGGRLSNQRIIFDALVFNIGQNNPAPWYPETRVPASGLMLADVQETSGGGATSVRFVFLGCKRWRTAQRSCDFPPAEAEDSRNG